MHTKICSKCKKEKLISDFRKNKNSKDGFRTQCRECEDNKYSHKCIVCGKEFKSAHKKQVYCSRKCSNEVRKNKITCYCEVCGKKIEFKKSVYDKNKHHYCSDKCRYEGFGKFYNGKNNPNYNKIEVKCEVCGKEFEISRARIDISKHHYCSYECQAKGYGLFFSKENHPMYGKEHTRETKIKISKANKFKFLGSKSPRWNPKLTQEERMKNRDTLENIQWRNNIYGRDNYTCQCCSKHGGDMIAHHLDGYNWCEDKRFDIDNGITLCEDCHKEFHHIYGYGNNTKEQYEEFIKIKKIKSA